MDFYRDGGREYLELHARRAPIYRDGYYEDIPENERDDVIAEDVRLSVEMFEARFGVELFLLGRSGRHVCIEDTAENRRRYPNLRRAANAACDRLFAGWRNAPKAGAR